MKKSGIAIGKRHKPVIRPDGRVVLECDDKSIRASLPVNKRIAARNKAKSRVRVVKLAK